MFITGVRVGLITATITAVLSMGTFSQTTKPAIESMPTATKEVVTSDSLKHDKKSTERDTSVQTVPPAGPAISVAENVEIQRRFNELRHELLDNHEKYIDWWLAVIAIIITSFGIGATIAGRISFRRFREIETEAKNSAETAAEHEEEAKRIVDEMKKRRDEFVTLTAETVADGSEEVKKAAADVYENPLASLIDKAIAQAILLQQQDKKDEAIEKWRAVAHIAEEIDNDQAARAWFSVGYLLENPEDSIAAYNQAIRLGPDFFEAYNNRGVAKGESDHYEDSIVDFDEAIRLKSDFADAYYNRGKTKDALGQHEEAIADYDEAIRLKSDHADAYNNRGLAKGALGQHEEAIADYDEAIRLKSDHADAYNNRGLAKGESGYYEDAIADCDEAIRLKPDHTKAYNNRGKAKDALGHHEEAIADYDEALRLEPDYANAYYNRGIAKGELKRIDEARQDFENARDLAREDGNDSLADLAEKLLRYFDSEEDE